MEDKDTEQRMEVVYEPHYNVLTKSGKAHFTCIKDGASAQQALAARCTRRAKFKALCSGAKFQAS